MRMRESNDCRFDPSRFIMEHYVDGDLVNDETPINRTKAAPDNLHVWGKVFLNEHLEHFKY